MRQVSDRAAHDRPGVGQLMVALVILPLVALLPIAPGLPDLARAGWTIGALGLILAAVPLGLVSRLSGAEVWVVSAYLAMAAGVGAASNSVSVTDHWLTVGYLVVLWGVLPFVLARLVEQGMLVRWSILVYFFSTTVSALVGVAQVVTGGPVAGVAPVFGRAAGLVGQPNIHGLMAGLAFLVGTAAFLKTRRVWVGALAAVQLLALLTSGSLSALAATATGLVVVLLVNGLRVRTILAAILLGALALVGVEQISSRNGEFRTPLERVAQTTGQTEEISTIYVRAETVRGAWDGITDDPFFGVGMDDSSGLGNGATLTHSLPVRAWYQGGLPLLAASVVLYASVAFRVHGALRLRREPAAAGVLVCLAVFSLTAASFSQPYFWIPFVLAWVVLARVNARRVTTWTVPTFGGHED